MSKPEDIERLATLCSDWPNWLHAAVTEAVELSDKKDWSTEQLVGYAIMAAEKRGAEREREACALLVSRSQFADTPGLPLHIRQSIVQHNTSLCSAASAIRNRGEADHG